MAKRSIPYLFLMIPLLLVGCGEDGAQSVVAPDEMALAKGGPGRDPFRDFNPPGQRLKIWQDWASFEAAVGSLVLIDFENLPWHGTSCAGGDDSDEKMLREEFIPNPLVLSETWFYDPDCLESYICPSPLCPEVNIVLHMSPKSKIVFPPGTEAAAIVVEGMAAGHFVLHVVNGNGGKTSVFGRTKVEQQTVFGFQSSAGIAEIRIGRVKGNSPLVLGLVAYQGVGEIVEGPGSIGE